MSTKSWPRKRKKVPGHGPVFRCRNCDEVTRDPLGHAQTHGLPSTMAQVWEGYALVASTDNKIVRKVKPDKDTNTLF